MRKLLGSFILVLFITAVASAQGESEGRGNSTGNRGQSEGNGRDDRDDKAPVQAGYGVITPVVAGTAGTTTGLVVFETFGLRKNNGNNDETTQAGILPPDLTTNAVLFVESSGRLSKNLGVAIVNPNSSNVNVRMTLRNDDGRQLGTKTVTVPARQQTSKFVTELFSSESGIPSDVMGTLVITTAGSSDLPVSVVGLRFRGTNFSTLPVTNLSGNSGPLPVIADGVGGPGAILLPQFATGGGWATELILANTGTSAITVRVDLFKQDGTPLTAALNGQSASSFRNLTIPAGGVIKLAPRDRNGDDDF